MQRSNTQKELKEEAVKLPDEVACTGDGTAGNSYYTLAEWRQKRNYGVVRFTAAAPNQKWLTDITQVPCADGKLYLAAVLDYYNGEIVGLAMDDNMKKELCVHAFSSACRSRSARGMILHSDRGSQYTSADFLESLARYDAVQNMSGTGHCYDNARMERFFCHAEEGEALPAGDREDEHGPGQKHRSGRSVSMI